MWNAREQDGVRAIGGFCSALGVWLVLEDAFDVFGSLMFRDDEKESGTKKIERRSLVQGVSGK